MRKDMHKVIIETGRTEGIGKFKGKENKYNNKDIWEIPPGGKIGMKNPYRNNPKSMSDKLSPLRRFIRSKVGQSWNSVYSEICKVFKGNGVLQDHIKRHVFDLIETKTGIVDGEVWVFDGSPRQIQGAYQMYSGDGVLYVHPETGLVSITKPGVSRKKRKEERERKAALRCKRISNRLVAFKEERLWYLVVLDELPKEFVEKKVTSKFLKNYSYTVKEFVSVYDVLLKNILARNTYAGMEHRMDYYKSDELYAKEKRLMGKRELKRFGLKNG